MPAASGLPERPTGPAGNDPDGVRIMYKCLNCGREVKIELKSAKKIICPFCGYRILRKARGETVRKVSAD